MLPKVARMWLITYFKRRTGGKGNLNLWFVDANSGHGNFVFQHHRWIWLKDLVVSQSSKTAHWEQSAEAQESVLNIAQSIHDRKRKTFS